MSNTVDILSELLAAHQKSLVVRLGESTMFVSRSAIDVMQLIERMGDAERIRSDRLVDAIQQLGGVPGFGQPDATSGDLHFQSIQLVIPRLVDDRRALIGMYSKASEFIQTDPAASQVVNDILQALRAELTELEQFLTHSLSEVTQDQSPSDV